MHMLIINFQCFEYFTESRWDRLVFIHFSISLVMSNRTECIGGDGRRGQSRNGLYYRAVCTALSGAARPLMNPVRDQPLASVLLNEQGNTPFPRLPTALYRWKLFIATYFLLFTFICDTRAFHLIGILLFIKFKYCFTTKKKYSICCLYLLWKELVTNR